MEASYKKLLSSLPEGCWRFKIVFPIFFPRTRGHACHWFKIPCVGGRSFEFISLLFGHAAHDAGKTCVDMGSGCLPTAFQVWWSSSNHQGPEQHDSWGIQRQRIARRCKEYIKYKVNMNLLFQTCMRSFRVEWLSRIFVSSLLYFPFYSFRFWAIWYRRHWLLTCWALRSFHRTFPVILALIQSIPDAPTDNRCNHLYWGEISIGNDDVLSSTHGKLQIIG